MIIQPGLEQPSVASMFELARTNSIRRVDVQLHDVTGTAIDIDKSASPGGDSSGALDLEVTDLGGNTIYQESYWPLCMTSTEKRIKHPTTGKYYIDFGDRPQETAGIFPILFNWHSRQNTAAEDVYRTQVMELVSPRVLSLLPTLRLMIDKTVKPNLPEKYCFLGYTDGMLVAFLRLGLHMINEYQPYPTFSSLEHFPLETHSNVLIKSAMYQGIISQTLFAIDTDVPQFSDSGHSFVLQHATPLAAFVDKLKQELDKAIPQFKLQLVNSGTVSIEARMDMAFQMLLSTAPYGSLFRNMWQGGG
jgi:hypothetical protein